MSDSERSLHSLSPVHEQVADFIHGALIQAIVMADRKAGILFTLVSAALVYLLSQVPFTLQSVTGMIWMAIIALLVLAAACAFLVIFPRTRHGTGDLLFWAAIARFPTRSSYISAVRNQSGQQIAEQKLGYCHDLACICARKFRLLDAAMILSAIGLIGLLSATALERIASG